MNCSIFQNPAPKTYASLNEFKTSLVKYGEKQAKIYENKFKNSSVKTIGELKQEIQKEFPKYKFVSSEPCKPINGQHLLYIDDKNLQKMLNDPAYKAKIFGLMRREHDALDINHSIKMASNMLNSNIASSVFSLSQSNENIGGVPYKGMAISAPMRADNAKFYGNAFVMKSNAKNKNFIKNSAKSDASKKKDPLQEILDKIEKLKKQLADLNAKIAKISSNSDEMSKELLAQLNAKAAQINAQIAALYEQIFRMCKIKA